MLRYRLISFLKVQRIRTVDYLFFGNFRGSLALRAGHSVCRYGINLSDVRCCTVQTERNESKN